MATFATSTVSPWSSGSPRCGTHWRILRHFSWPARTPCQPHRARRGIRKEAWHNVKQWRKDIARQPRNICDKLRYRRRPVSHFLLPWTSNCPTSHVHEGAVECPCLCDSLLAGLVYVRLQSSWYHQYNIYIIQLHNYSCLIVALMRLMAERTTCTGLRESNLATFAWHRSLKLCSCKQNKPLRLSNPPWCSGRCCLTPACDILKYSGFLLFGRWIPLASVRGENDTKVIHNCLRKSVSTRLPLSISASGPQARKELIDPMLRVGSLPVSPCYSGATCAGCDLETGGSHPVFHQSLNCTLNSAQEVSGSRPDQCFDYFWLAFYTRRVSKLPAILGNNSCPAPTHFTMMLFSKVLGRLCWRNWHGMEPSRRRGYGREPAPCLRCRCIGQ